MKQLDSNTILALNPVGRVIEVQHEDGVVRGLISGVRRDRDNLCFDFEWQAHNDERGEILVTPGGGHYQDWEREDQLDGGGPIPWYEDDEGELSFSSYNETVGNLETVILPEGQGLDPHHWEPITSRE